MLFESLNILSCFHPDITHTQTHTPPVHSLVTVGVSSLSLVGPCFTVNSHIICKLQTQNHLIAFTLSSVNPAIKSSKPQHIPSNTSVGRVQEG